MSRASEHQRGRVLIASLLTSALAGCGANGSATPTTTAPTGGEVIASEGALNGGPPEAAALPDATAAAASVEDPTIVEMISVRPGFAPDPIVRRGVGGGPVDASSLDERCRGYIGDAQHFDLKVDAPTPSLRLMVHMEGDATLVIRLADGTYVCNDDSEGLDPIIEGSALPRGRHRVYVGTYSASGVGTPFTIAFTSQHALSTGGLGAFPIP